MYLEEWFSRSGLGDQKDEKNWAPSGRQSDRLLTAEWHFGALQSAEGEGVLTAADVPCSAWALPQPLLTVIPRQPAEYVPGLSGGGVKADGREVCQGHCYVASVCLIHMP